MPNFDGVAEDAEILGRLTQNVAGGRVHQLMPDAEQIEKFTNGQIKPFVVYRSGTPVRLTRGRTIVGERLQPYRVPITIGSYAGDINLAKQQTAWILDLMLDWQPTANSTPMVTDGGDSFSERESANTPTRFADLTYWSIIINMEPDETDVAPPIGVAPQ